MDKNFDSRLWKWTCNCWNPSFTTSNAHSISARMSSFDLGICSANCCLNQWHFFFRAQKKLEVDYCLLRSLGRLWQDCRSIFITDYVISTWKFIREWCFRVLWIGSGGTCPIPRRYYFCQLSRLSRFTRSHSLLVPGWISTIGSQVSNHDADIKKYVRRRWWEMRNPNWSRREWREGFESSSDLPFPVKITYYHRCFFIRCSSYHIQPNKLMFTMWRPYYAMIRI